MDFNLCYCMLLGEGSSIGLWSNCTVSFENVYQCNSLAKIKWHYLSLPWKTIKCMNILHLHVIFIFILGQQRVKTRMGDLGCS